MRRVIGRGVARDKVDCARSRRSKHRTVGVVIQRKVLRVVPQRCDGIAVVVAHHQIRSITVVRASSVGAHSQELHKFIHKPAVKCLLFRHVVVVLIAGIVLRTIEPEGIVEVRIVIQESVGKAVYS